MNWNKLILSSAVATAVVALPISVQARPEGRGSSSRASFAGSSRSFAPRSVAPRSFGSSSGRANIAAGRAGNSRNWGSGRGSNVRNGQGSNFRNGRGSRGGTWANGNRWSGRGRHHHHHHRRYYPYYGYYPFSYGYPFWGASAALYYNGYDSGYDGYYSSEGNGGSASLVMNVQEELARAGYYHGAIDGIIGNGTRSAIRAYERANGLRSDGRIDSDLLSSMGLG